MRILRPALFLSPVLSPPRGLSLCLFFFLPESSLAHNDEADGRDDGGVCCVSVSVSVALGLVVFVRSPRSINLQDDYGGFMDGDFESEVSTLINQRRCAGCVCVCRSLCSCTR